MKLKSLGDEIWIAADSSFKFLIWLQIGTRMTVVRLRDGGLWLHSPIALSDALKAEIDALGPVRAIVCPNQFHHMFAAGYVTAYPEAKLYGAPSIMKRQKHLSLDYVMGSEFEQPSDWSAALDSVFIAGSAFEETVFYHRTSKTLITSDIIEYFTEHEHWFTRLYLKLMGTYKNPSFPKMIKSFYKDKALARQAFETMLAWDFERMVIAHGNVLVEDDPKGAIRRTYSWLLD